MNENNRSFGWKNAKLSGHLNEHKISEEIVKNTDFRINLFNRLNIKDDFISIFESGLKEKNVESILGDKIKKKADLIIVLENDKTLNLSIKKSKSGQVHFVTIDRFINGFELQFKKSIPENVKKSINLFWGYDYENNIIDNMIIDYGTNLKYEKRKHRIVAETLKLIDPNLTVDLLKWFKENIYEITIYCFSSGLVKNKELFANYIWYKNLINDKNLDFIFNIEEIAHLCKKNTDSIRFGNKNGGSTIILPFGFVQWHQNKIQFHHSLKSIQNLFN